MAFISICNYFKRRSEGLSHDTHPGTGQLSRQNEKEREEHIWPCPLLQPTPIQETRVSSRFAHKLRMCKVIFGGARKFTHWLMPKEEDVHVGSKPGMTSNPRHEKFHCHNRMQSYGRPTCKHAPSHVVVNKHQRRCSHYTKYSWHVCRRLWSIYCTTYRHLSSRVPVGQTWAMAKQLWIYYI